MAHLHSVRRDMSHDCLRANVCTTIGLVAFLCRNIDGARLAPIVNCCNEYFVCIASRFREVLSADGGCLLLPRGHTLHISRNGKVSGFIEMQRAVHHTLEESWFEVWAAMRADNILYVDEGDGSLHSLRDLVFFVAML